MANQVSISEPSILSANTYFWNAAGNASTRRRNEEKRQAEVAAYFKAIGMEVETSGNSVIGEKDGIVAEFSYSESCKNVYKSLSVTRNGNGSNITALRKLASKVGC